MCVCVCVCVWYTGYMCVCVCVCVCVVYRVHVLTEDGVGVLFLRSALRGLGGTLAELPEPFLPESSALCLPSTWERLE